ncbi:hypothetical protein [Telmatospirillum sp. J64-1]|uniref:hypothetical protein n=1 Tax=Telmatospirillum sp. J64-1 TaxID=2502183 RepID=UPI00115D5EB6|nr:hypothetical protein [Telmatospirillum sp. J64-1]
MKLTIRMNAAEDVVVIDGHTFDRTGLDRNQRYAMAALVRDALFPRQPERKRKPRKSHAKRRR